MSNYLKKISQLSIKDWIFIVFTILWIFIIVLDYLNKQEVYYYSVAFYSYYLYTFGLLAFASGISFYATGSKYFKKWPKFRLNGLAVVLLCILLIWCTVIAFNIYWKGPLGPSNYFHLAYRFLFSCGGTFIVLLASFSIGDLLLKNLDLQLKSSLTNKLISILSGFLILSYCLMLMASFELLIFSLVWALLSVFILLNYKNSLQFIKNILWDPFRIPKDLNYWGGLCLFAILFILILDYFYTQSPFPLGFDARNYYLNIPKLISDSGAMVEGFQPYAWGLIMSIGYIGFDSAEITLLLSALGGVLSIFALYDLCKNYLNINSNWSLIAGLLFITIPAVNNHMVIEYKIDLALVFVHLTLINVLLYWVSKKKNNKNPEALSITKFDYKLFAIIGLILGFSLAIKVLSFLFIFGFLLIIWWYLDKDYLGVFGLASIGSGIIILAELDKFGALRDYHTNPNFTAKIFLGIGLILFIYSIIQKSQHVIKKIFLSLTLVAMGFISFAPWMYKNYKYSDSFNLEQLMIGTNPKPVLDWGLMEANYLEYIRLNEKNRNEE